MSSTSTITESGIINFKEKLAELAQEFYESIQNFLTEHENKFKGKMKMEIKRPTERDKELAMGDRSPFMKAMVFYWPLKQGPNDGVYASTDFGFNDNRTMYYKIHLGKNVFVNVERTGDADEMLAQLEKDFKVVIKYFENPKEHLFLKFEK